MPTIQDFKDFIASKIKSGEINSKTGNNYTMWVNRLVAALNLEPEDNFEFFTLDNIRRGIEIFKEQYCKYRTLSDDFQNNAYSCAVAVRRHYVDYLKSPTTWSPKIKHSLREGKPLPTPETQTQLLPFQNENTDTASEDAVSVSQEQKDQAVATESTPLFVLEALKRFRVLMESNGIEAELLQQTAEELKVCKCRFRLRDVKAGAGSDIPVFYGGLRVDELVHVMVTLALVAFGHQDPAALKQIPVVSGSDTNSEPVKVDAVFVDGVEQKVESIPAVSFVVSNALERFNIFMANYGVEASGVRSELGDPSYHFEISNSRLHTFSEFWLDCRELSSDALLQTLINHALSVFPSLSELKKSVEACRKVDFAIDSEKPQITFYGPYPPGTLAKEGFDPKTEPEEPPTEETAKPDFTCFISSAVVQEFEKIAGGLFRIKAVTSERDLSEGVGVFQITAENDNASFLRSVPVVGRSTKNVACELYSDVVNRVVVEKVVQAEQTKEPEKFVCARSALVAEAFAAIPGNNLPIEVTTDQEEFDRGEGSFTITSPEESTRFIRTVQLLGSDSAGVARQLFDDVRQRLKKRSSLDQFRGPLTTVERPSDFVCWRSELAAGIFRRIEGNKFQIRSTTTQAEADQGHASFKITNSKWAKETYILRTVPWGGNDAEAVAHQLYTEALGVGDLCFNTDPAHPVRPAFTSYESLAVAQAFESLSHGLYKIRVTTTAEEEHRGEGAFLVSALDGTEEATYVLTTAGRRARHVAKELFEMVKAGIGGKISSSGVEPKPTLVLTSYQFPLRQDVQVSFSLPADLTGQEAKRLARFVSSLGLG